MFQAKFVEKIKTHFIYNNFVFHYLSVNEIMWKYTVERAGPQTIQYGVCVLHAGYLRLQTHIQNL